MNAETAKWVIGIGISITLIGLAIYFLGDKLSWLGRLPGDIRIERENFRFYFPITTMVLLSILVSLIIRLIQFLSK
ncbi:DUF2905 domain-containing protein [Echinicola sp. CAU 1574]|uniref:DUF2905 domain-containing protein n=1 Tax=Echinicola arenosa TaxID=2774144 RepID=A0ABR9AMR7_9BACT|nr:DUF2905 domain-containing protein [Echinicola arenosa]MBD8488914.1 DUF2905 domain-containing protein [Echinicola arenosa]